MKKVPYIPISGDSPNIDTIEPCGERKTLLSANFEVWSCDRTCVPLCAPVVHFLASLTPSPTTYHQDDLR